MSRRRRREFSVWQSFVDLGMALVAVMALSLVVLVQKQQTAMVLLEEQAVEMKADRQEFAVQLLLLMSKIDGIVVAQDGAEEWLATQFRQDGCQLELGKGGELRVQGSGEDSDLYNSGQTRLSRVGAEALESCRDSFLRLAYAVAERPEAAGDGADDICLNNWRTFQNDLSKEGVAQALSRLRGGLDALVLEGNTDRKPPTKGLSGGPVPPIVGPRGRRLTLSPVASSFVGNALFGAERARQALGHLLYRVQDCNRTERDALEVLMSKARIESPAFGRYLAGPLDERRSGCVDGSDECSAARNLSLRIRWRKEELRRPYNEFRGQFCLLLKDGRGPLVEGLRQAGRDIDRLRRKYCDE